MAIKVVQKKSAQQKDSRKMCKNQSLIRGEPAPSMLILTPFTIFKTGQYIEQKFAELFGTPPLKVRHFTVLRVLEHGEARTQQELSEALWIDRATMTALIKDLLAEKMVKRLFHEKDGRSFILSITAAGRAYYKQHEESFTRLGREIFPTLTDQELNQVQAILRKAMLAVVRGL